MKNLIKSVFFFLLAIHLLACNGDNTSANKSEESKDIVIGKLLGYRDDICTVEGQQPLHLYRDTSMVTAILLRPAETLPTRPSLSDEGRKRGDLLSHVFVLSGIDQIYGEGNDGLQTGMMTSKSNYCSHGVMTDEGPDHLAKFLLKNYKGKKVMVIGNPTMMTNALNHLAGQGKYTMPADEYDHVFIVQARALGNADVYHFKY